MATAGLPFDDRDGFIWYDGRLIPWRDAKLHVLTHALHYPSCVFEGERVYNGKVFRLDDHNARLHNSANILGFEVPASMDDFVEGGDVHTNSGIPNKAFYLAASGIGGNSWDKSVKIWYGALPLLKSAATFADAAKATTATPA